MSESQSLGFAYLTRCLITTVSGGSSISQPFREDRSRLADLHHGPGAMALHETLAGKAWST
jgi:hypothetical protein